jgi:two-component system phosphate regulon response regulator PhoB
VAGKGRILIADDDEALQLLLRRVATKAGFEVVQAFDGEGAVATAVAEKPDCILLDIMMPRLDGRDVLKRLKAAPETKDIPVILFSARGEHSDRIAGLELGADDYVEKPFNVDMLLRRVEYRVWKKRGEDGPPPA